MITQVSAQDVERSSTMTKRCIGKWCVISCGCFLGFKKTREEAEEMERVMNSPLEIEKPRCRVETVNADCYYCSKAKTCKILAEAEDDIDNKFN